MTINVALFIYPDVEVLDFSGPYEVFSTASRIAEAPAPFSPFLVAETTDTVSARANYQVVPHYGFDQHPRIDLLIVPGGVHVGEMEKTRVIEWISSQAAQAQHVASVCTGAFLLAQAGVILDETVTTHWEDTADLRRSFPALTVLDDVRWVDAEHVTTSAGISAGIDTSLHLVRRFAGARLAEQTALKMEYDWRDLTDAD